jgi:flagellin
MPLNVISNYAANVAHRNLMASDMAATNSLAKLSAGTRVLSAKDDAAALAVGSRLALEVSGLKQASVNAGQASSMLQIADGAMSKVFDILSRMKSLAVQAGSGQLSDTDRTNLNTEYQQLSSEIGRIADNTTFSGTQLVAGGQTVQSAPAGLQTGDFVSSITVKNFDLGGNTTSAAYSIAYDGSNNFTLTDGTTSWKGVLAPGASSGGVLTAPVTVKLTAAGSDAEMDINLGANFQTNSAGTIASVAITLQGNSTTSFTFKVGTGTTASDDITISLSSVTQDALGLTGDAISTVAAASTASDHIDSAVTQLNTSRATVGALQNRLDFAASNISIATENTEAARSNLIDLDVASEISSLTSKQILIQTGVAMLAQANQLPQHLLRLLQ